MIIVARLNARPSCIRHEIGLCLIVLHVIRRRVTSSLVSPLDRLIIVDFAVCRSHEPLVMILELLSELLLLVGSHKDTVIVLRPI